MTTKFQLGWCSRCEKCVKKNHTQTGLICEECGKLEDGFWFIPTTSDSKKSKSQVTVASYFRREAIRRLKEQGLRVPYY